MAAEKFPIDCSGKHDAQRTILKKKIKTQNAFIALQLQLTEMFSRWNRVRRSLNIRWESLQDSSLNITLSDPTALMFETPVKTRAFIRRREKNVNCWSTGIETNLNEPPVSHTPMAAVSAESSFLYLWLRAIIRLAGNRHIHTSGDRLRLWNVNNW